MNDHDQVVITKRLLLSAGEGTGIDSDSQCGHRLVMHDWEGPVGAVVAVLRVATWQQRLRASVEAAVPGLASGGERDVPARQLVRHDHISAILARRDGMAGL